MEAARIVVQTTEPQRHKELFAMAHSTPQNPNEKPSCRAPIPNHIPATMKAERRWILWQFEWDGRKWTKTPINAATGRHASSTNPSTWTTFSAAWSAYQRGGVDGIGFVLGDGWAGVDLDDHLDGDGRVTQFGQHVIRRMNSYMEVSPSGEGIKVFVRGSVEHGHKDDKNGIEIYASGRYFTVTGWKLSDSPDDVADRQAELVALVNELKPPLAKVAPAWRQLSDCEKASAALQHLSPSRADGYHDWIAAGMALHSVDGSLLEEWDRWSSQSSKHEANCCSRAWASFGNRCGYSIASLIYWADQDSPGWRDGYRATTHTGERAVRAAATNHTTRLVVHRMSDVQPRRLEWLWPDRIPLGKLTLLAGDPGLGKSYVTCDLAARVSRGMVWPDDSTKRQPVGSVVMFNCEDGLEDTIRPRLDFAGADVSKIISIEGTTTVDPDSGEDRQRGFSLVVDLPRLEEVVRELTDCRLIVIDPVSAYCGETDSHKNADVRALLAPLAALAEKYHVAIVMITHLSKGTGTKSLYRAMGSMAFAAAARAVWHFAKDPDDESRRLMLPAKMNLAPDPTGLAYRIENGGVHWEADPVRMTADDILAREAKERDGRANERKEAEDWIRDYLAGRSVGSTQLKSDALEHGITSSTLRRALINVCGKPRKSSMDGPWMWSLPGNGFD